MTTAVNDT